MNLSFVSSIVPAHFTLPLFFSKNKKKIKKKEINSFSKLSKVGTIFIRSVASFPACRVPFPKSGANNFSKSLLSKTIETKRISFIRDKSQIILRNYRKQCYSNFVMKFIENAKIETNRYQKIMEITHERIIQQCISSAFRWNLKNDGQKSFIRHVEK